MEKYFYSITINGQYSGVSTNNTNNSQQTYYNDTLPDSVIASYTNDSTHETKGSIGLTFAIGKSLTKIKNININAFAAGGFGYSWYSHLYQAKPITQIPISYNFSIGIEPTVTIYKRIVLGSSFGLRYYHQEDYSKYSNYSKNQKTDNTNTGTIYYDSQIDSYDRTIVEIFGNPFSMNMSLFGYFQF